MTHIVAACIAFWLTVNLFLYVWIGHDSATRLTNRVLENFRASLFD